MIDFKMIIHYIEGILKGEMDDNFPSLSRKVVPFNPTIFVGTGRDRNLQLGQYMKVLIHFFLQNAFNVVNSPIQVSPP